MINFFYIPQSRMTLSIYLSLKLISLCRLGLRSLLPKREGSLETSVRITKTTPSSSSRYDTTLRHVSSLPRFITLFHYIYTLTHFLVSLPYHSPKIIYNNSIELLTSAYVIHRAKGNDGWCKQETTNGQR